MKRVRMPLLNGSRAMSKFSLSYLINEIDPFNVLSVCVSSYPYEDYVRCLLFLYTSRYQSFVRAIGNPDIAKQFYNNLLDWI